MLELLGSQFTWILFLIIGGIVFVLFEKVTKRNVSEKHFNCFFSGCLWIAIIVSFVCYFLYTCSHPYDD